MAEYIERDLTAAEPCEKHEKIKTPFAQIIIRGTVENPCYSILYFDPTDKECHVGFSSFCRDYVFKWLLEEFEIVGTAADVVAVVRCKDCIHYEMGVCLKIYSDGAVSQYAWQERKSDDFCSYGERRTDNG